MGNKRSKITAQVALIFSYLPLTSAQGFSIGSTSGSSTVVEFFNDMVFYTFEVSSVPEIILFFVAPLFGFYMINKNILTVGFESFEERIGRSSYGRTSDDIPSGLKGVSIAIAFMTVQVAGIFGTVLLLAAGGLAFLAWLSTYAGLFGNGSNGSGGDIQRLNNEIQDIKNKLDEAGSEEKEAENRGNAAETEDAEEEIEVALEEMEDVEMKLEQLLEADEGRLTNAINEAQEVLQEEQTEQSIIVDIRNRLGRIRGALKEIYQVTSKAAQAIENNRWGEAVKEGSLPKSAFTQSGEIASTSFHGGAQAMFDLSDVGYDQYSGLKNVYEDLQDVAEDVQRIRNIEEQESPEVKDEVQTLVNEAVRFTEAFRIIRMLNSELQEAENEDKMMEKIAKEFNSKEIFQIAEQEEKEEKQLEQELQQLMDMEKKIENELEQAEQLLEEEEEGEVQEIRELKEEIQQEENIEQLLGQMEGLTSYFGPKGKDNVAEELEDMIGMMEKIENIMVKIEKVKEKEANQMEKAEGKISEAISKTA